MNPQINVWYSDGSKAHLLSTWGPWRAWCGILLHAIRIAVPADEKCQVCLKVSGKLSEEGSKRSGEEEEEDVV